MAWFEQRGASWRATVNVPKTVHTSGKLRATFDTEKEARDWAAGVERKKVLGALPDVGSQILVGDMLEEFLDGVASKTDSAKWNRLRIMKWLLDPLATRRLTEVHTHDINEWIARRLKLVSGSTVNRELNLMGAAFTYAVKERRWIKENPVHGCRRPPEGPPRHRPLLAPEELQAVAVASGFDVDLVLSTNQARTAACFFFALETGMRSGEILRLRPIDYRRKDRYTRVSALEQGGRKGSRSGKVAAGRDVPLTERAIELLDQLLATMPADQPYIVGLTDQQRDAAWRQIRDKAGIEDLTFHDSKHEACTRLSQYIDIIALSHAIGTKDIRLLRDTYYHQDATRLAALLPKKLSAS